MSGRYQDRWGGDDERLLADDLARRILYRKPQKPETVEKADPDRDPPSERANEEGGTPGGNGL